MRQSCARMIQALPCFSYARQLQHIYAQAVQCALTLLGSGAGAGMDYKVSLSNNLPKP